MFANFPYLVSFSLTSNRLSAMRKFKCRNCAPVAVILISYDTRLYQMRPSLHPPPLARLQALHGRPQGLPTGRLFDPGTSRIISYRWCAVVHSEPFRAGNWRGVIDALCLLPQVLRSPPDPLVRVSPTLLDWLLLRPISPQPSTRRAST